jgi:hypothetical protein
MAVLRFSRQLNKSEDQSRIILLRVHFGTNIGPLDKRENYGTQNYWVFGVHRPVF